MANHLLDTQSLYLRKHAENPIDWWYWGEEALTLAKLQNKPIFLSIGYSSCHWCTVMEGEAFSDESIAEYLNEHFIAIKVDREERPDVDNIYMTALQMMTGQGGWPLNIFLSPDDLIPFYGGTYFPVEPRYNKPGFLQILESLNDFYHNQPEKLDNLKSEIKSALEANAQLNTSTTIQLNQDIFEQGISKNAPVISQSQSGRPSFPMMPYANLTLQNSIENTEYRQLAINRAVDLVNGGIYDHVGGGFHRYTVDSNWTVPHFEKMLYDNGLIMEFLANLWSTGVEIEEIKEAVEGTYNWLKREMTIEEGYFSASQDADNFASVNQDEPEEGDFYVWSYRDLQQILSPSEFIAFDHTFELSKQGNFEGKNVLQKKVDKPINTTIKNCYQKLFKARYGDYPTNLISFPPARNNEEAKSIPWHGRIPPVTDTKMILSWNCLMISGLARAYGVFKQEKYLLVAQKAMDFILANQWQNDRLYRLNYDGEVSILAQAEDYALLIKALLDLTHNHSDNSLHYLEQAIKVQTEFDFYCGDQQNGGYYNNANDNNDLLLIREKSYIDHATPSANGIAIANLVRLGLLTDNLKYLDKAEKTLNLFAETMSNNPLSCPTLFIGFDWYLQGSSVKTNLDIKHKLLAQYLPTTIYQISDDLPENSIGIVCKRLSCFEPATTQNKLLEQIQS